MRIIHNVLKVYTCKNNIGGKNVNNVTRGELCTYMFLRLITPKNVSTLLRTSVQRKRFFFIACGGRVRGGDGHIPVWFFFHCTRAHNTKRF